MCEEVRGRKIGREIKCRKEGTLSRFGGKKTNEGERRGEEGDEEDCGGKFGKRKKTKAEKKKFLKLLINRQISLL